MTYDTAQSEDLKHTLQIRDSSMPPRNSEDPEDHYSIYAKNVPRAHRKVSWVSDAALSSPDRGEQRQPLFQNAGAFRLNRVKNGKRATEGPKPTAHHQS